MIELQNFNMGWNLPQVFSHNISHNIQQAKILVSNSTQQVGESLKTTANTATDTVINTLNSASQQAKGAIDQTFHQTFQGTIAYSVSDWLQDYPALIKIFNILGWGTNHPIISLVIIILFFAIIFSLVKAIVRVIETASWSLLKIPFQLIGILLKLAFTNLSKIAGYSFKQITQPKTSNTALALNVANFEPVIPDKQQRLIEISVRLEELQKEQNQLLQEATELMSSSNSQFAIQNSQL
ncbi:MAG: hypothetical protein KME64_10885 [Scytonematopsis contorta HA4267-MV1]|jgi:hypothetical protein|nr:hypothetical protein [Scytonematopsis contorta HA4267-MV1]